MMRRNFEDVQTGVTKNLTSVASNLIASPIKCIILPNILACASEYTKCVQQVIDVLDVSTVSVSYRFVYNDMTHTM